MPTFNTFWSQVSVWVKAHEDRRTNAVSYLSQETTNLAAIDVETASIGAVTAAFASFRGRLAGLVGTGSMKALLDGYLLQAGTLIKSPERKKQSPDTATIASPDLVRYMVDNPDSISPVPRVRSRQFTRGAVSAGGSNVGNGTIYRLCVTADGQPYENTTADTIKYKCSQDLLNGATAGQELFDVDGLPLTDALDYYQSGKGSGFSFRLVGGKDGTAKAAISADTSATQGINNPSFADGGATSGAAPTSWTPGTAANFDVVAANDAGGTATSTTYRTAKLEQSAACSVKFKATDTLSQKFSTNNKSLDLSTPYFLRVAYNASIGTAVGTLKIELGGASITHTVTGETGWHTLVLAIDKNLWPTNFGSGVADVAVKITYTKTSGTLLVDDVVFGPFFRYDNHWHAIVSESTPFQLNDSFTFTDTEIGSTGASIQRKFHLAYGVTLPCCPPPPSNTGFAAALAGAGAGNVDNGVHLYKITKKRKISDTDYSESGGNTQVSVTVADKTTNGKVNVTSNVTDTDGGIYAYEIYRTTAGGSTYYFVGEVLYAARATPLLDNTSDATLVSGAQIPGGISPQDDP